MGHNMNNELGPSSYRPDTAFHLLPDPSSKPHTDPSLPVKTLSPACPMCLPLTLPVMLTAVSTHQLPEGFFSTTLSHRSVTVGAEEQSDLGHPRGLQELLS